MVEAGEVPQGEETEPHPAPSPSSGCYTIPLENATKRYVRVNFDTGEVDQSDTPDGFVTAPSPLAHRLMYDAPHHGTCALACVNVVKKMMEGENA